MKEKKSVGRPLLDELPRVPVNALVKPCTIDVLKAWGKKSGISRGIYIDQLVQAENQRRGGK